MNSILQLSEKKIQSSQSLMMNEIVDFISKNMNEMHKALDELKLSYEEEIKSVDGR
jgi:hypothetical protein